MTVTPQDAPVGTPQDVDYAIHELDHLTHQCPIDGCQVEVSNLDYLCPEHSPHVPDEIHEARRQAVAAKSREGFDAAWFAALAHLHTEVDDVDLAPEWERHGARAARERDRTPREKAEPTP